MNTTATDGNDNLRYAEYVLGVLDADARAAVAQEVQTTDEAAAAVALWQRRLMPLTDDLPSVPPAPYVWARIHDALQLDMPARVTPRRGLWNNLPLWHWLGLGASAVAVALIVVVVAPYRASTPVVATSSGYMVSTIAQNNGVTGWTATMDLDHARMVVVPGAPAALADGHAPELWLIPAGGKPISVGIIRPDAPTTIALDPSLLKNLGPTALLAVSVEPIGGSPTGQPTGAVIAKGSISGSTDSQDHVVRVAAILNGVVDHPAA